MPPKKPKLTQRKNLRDLYNVQRASERREARLAAAAELAAAQAAPDAAGMAQDVAAGPVAAGDAPPAAHVQASPVGGDHAAPAQPEVREAVPIQDFAGAPCEHELETAIERVVYVSVDTQTEEMYEDIHPGVELVRDIGVGLQHELEAEVERVVYSHVETQTEGLHGDIHQGVDVGINMKPASKNSSTQTLKITVHVRSKALQTTPSTKDVGINVNIEPVRADKETQRNEWDIPESLDLNTEVLASALRRVLCPIWSVSSRDNMLHIMMIENHPSPVVSKSVRLLDMDIGIAVHGQDLKNNHSLWDLTDNFGIGKDSTSSKAFDILKLLTERIAALKVCEGCRKCDEIWNEGVFATRGFVDKFYTTIPVYRSNSCSLLINDDVCHACRSEQTNMVRKLNRRKKRELMPRNVSKINLKYMPKHILVNALKELRVDNTMYRKQIKFMRLKVNTLIEKQGESIGKNWSEKFTNICKENFDRMTPLQQLFWDQQMKQASLKNKASMKWHPMVIRLALQLQKTSASNTENMRRSGFISLPGRRTLYDYSHFIEAKEGCQQEIVEDIRKQFDQKCSEDEDHEKLVVLMFDGMHVRSNLFFSKTTGEIIGYAKLTEIEEEFENLQSEWSGAPVQKQLAKEVLVFMVKNITQNDPSKVVKDVVAVYSLPPNTTASGYFVRLWEVIASLENSGVPVVAVTCDGAATNRTCLSMHSKYVPTSDDDDWFDHTLADDDLVHTTTNVASPTLRPLFFIIDPPHWMKTLRNSFANSYCHKKSRRLWNGEDITWELVIRYYEDHKNDKFRKVMLTREHVYLNAFSVMNVSRAAQVMSKKMSIAVTQSGEEAVAKGIAYPPFKAAAEYMLKSNDAFDCLNGHNITSGTRFKNANLAPYTSCSDSRFQLLQDYVDYLDQWQDRVMDRPGRFSRKERKAMMLPEQTISAVKLTVASFTGLVKYLLKNGAKAVSARRLCQDPLEQIFSTWRRQGGSSNNPDVAQVLQTRVAVHAQRQVALPSKRGNTSSEMDSIVIDNTAVPKRKKKKIE